MPEYRDTIMTLSYKTFSNLFTLSHPAPANGAWLVSDWAAGQTPNMNWEADNVRRTSSGAVELVLDRAPGASRPYAGGEIQSQEIATTGSFGWNAQAPVMRPGAVFGLFTYRADWENQPWVEFDFEFVGADTTKVQLNIHMETPSGRHVTLAQKNGAPVIVDLGFDAAKGVHEYRVVVSETKATFLVDGKVVGVYGAEDMPGGIWRLGPMKSYVDLWSAKGLESWTGTWEGSSTPLVGRVESVGIRAGDLSLPTSPPAAAPEVEPAPVIGDDRPDPRPETDDADLADGAGGDDTSQGGAGDDPSPDASGDGRFPLDFGTGRIDGGDGTDWLEVNGSDGATVDLTLTGAQPTGYGNGPILGIENVSGGAGADRLLGHDGANQLSGNDGSDRLIGRGGNDLLTGDSGDDVITGGLGNDSLFGGEGQDQLQLDGGDDLIDGGTGVDTVFYNGTAAITINLSQTGPQATGSGNDTIRNVENVSGGFGADRLTGNAQSNVLAGNGGADMLMGGAGADTLAGGNGRDLLSGGADRDRDVFVFNYVSDSPAGGGRDVVENFVSGIDDLDLRGVDGNAAMAGHQALFFNGGTAASHAVWFTTSGGNGILHADVTGDGQADTQIWLSGVTALVAGDLLL
jgi:Ca2+-binding RTX toxin-like protein